MYADAGRDIRQVVLIARRDDSVVPTSVFPVPIPGILRETVKAHQSHPVIQVSVVGNCHPALAGRDRFVCIEGKTSYLGRSLATPPPRLSFPFPPGSWEAVGGIFDNPQAALRGEIMYRAHIHHHSANVDWHNS